MSQQIIIFFCLGTILLFASYSDIRNHRIVNILTLPSILIGISLNTYFQTGVGFASSIYGLLIGFFCLLPFYIAGGMAAGDVKLMSAVGAFVGAPLIFKVVLMSMICGSILGLVWLVRFDGIAEFLRRYLLIAKYSLYTGSLHYVPPKEGSIALLRFPYALAITSGTAAAIGISM